MFVDVQPLDYDIQAAQSGWNSQTSQATIVFNPSREWVVERTLVPEMQAMSLEDSQSVRSGYPQSRLIYEESAQHAFIYGTCRPPLLSAEIGSRMDYVVFVRFSEETGSGPHNKTPGEHDPFSMDIDSAPSSPSVYGPTESMPDWWDEPEPMDLCGVDEVQEPLWDTLQKNGGASQSLLLAPFPLGSWPDPSPL